MQATTGKSTFGQRLRAALKSAGYDARPSVLEREFNKRHRGAAMTLHGVRRWLLGETIPGHDKILTLSKWLGVQPHVLQFGVEATRVYAARRSKLPQLSVPTEEHEAVQAYLRLPAAARRAVREVVQALDVAHNGS